MPTASMLLGMVPGLRDQRRGGQALLDPRAWDHAARDFKRHLKVARCWKPSSANLALAVVDHFSRFLERTL